MSLENSGGDLVEVVHSADQSDEPKALATAPPQVNPTELKLLQGQRIGSKAALIMQAENGEVFVTLCDRDATTKLAHWLVDFLAGNN